MCVCLCEEWNGGSDSEFSKPNMCVVPQKGENWFTWLFAIKAQMSLPWFGFLLCFSILTAVSLQLRLLYLSITNTALVSSENILWKLPFHCPKSITTFLNLQCSRLWALRQPAEGYWLEYNVMCSRRERWKVFSA